jgi:hypothetical protein
MTAEEIEEMSVDLFDTLRGSKKTVYRCVYIYHFILYVYIYIHICTCLYICIYIYIGLSGNIFGMG